MTFKLGSLLEGRNISVVNPTGPNATVHYTGANTIGITYYDSPYSPPNGKQLIEVDTTLGDVEIAPNVPLQGDEIAVIKISPDEYNVQLPEATWGFGSILLSYQGDCGTLAWDGQNWINTSFASGLGQGIFEITSEDDSVTITNPFGPITDLSVSESGGGDLTHAVIAVADQYTVCPWATYTCDGVNDELYIQDAITEVLGYGSSNGVPTVLLVGSNFGTGASITISPGGDAYYFALVGLDSVAQGAAPISTGIPPSSNGVILNSTLALQSEADGIYLSNVNLSANGESPNRLDVSGCSSFNLYAKDSLYEIYSSSGAFPAGTVTANNCSTSIGGSVSSTSQSYVIGGGSFTCNSPHMGNLAARGAQIYLYGLDGVMSDTEDAVAQIDLIGCGVLLDAIVTMGSVWLSQNRFIVFDNMYLKNHTGGLLAVTNNFFQPPSAADTGYNNPPDGTYSLSGPIIVIAAGTAADAIVVGNVFYGGASGMITDNSGVATISPNWP